MTCKAVSNRLSAYLDGELAGREMLDVRAHLAQCPQCELEYRELARMKQCLSGFGCAEPPADLEERLVRSVLGPARTSTSIVRPVRLGWAMVAVAAAALAVVAITRNNVAADVAAQERLEQVAFELARDQAYSAGNDPLAGRSGVIPVTYGHR